MTFEEQQERYVKDPEFHQLVDLFYASVFLPGMFSMSEIRDAVTFAAIKFEMEKVRPLWGRYGRPEHRMGGDKG